MPRIRSHIPKALLGSAVNRAAAAAARPTGIDREYIKKALGRRKQRTNQRAKRAADLYAISREVNPSPDHQARARLQDAYSHDWDKARSAPGLPSYGAMQDQARDNIGDVQDVL
jgi:hypothetical protein